MAFFGKSAAQFTNAARIFCIEFAVRFKCAPVWGDLLLTLSRSFGGSVCGNPRKDAGRDGTCDRRAVPPREGFSQLLNRCEFAFGHPAHEFIYFNWRRNDECASPPPFAFGAVNLADFRKTFVVRKFFLP